MGFEFFHHFEFFEDVLGLFDQCSVPFCMCDVGFEQLPSSLFSFRLQQQNSEVVIKVRLVVRADADHLFPHRLYTMEFSFL